MGITRYRFRTFAVATAVTAAALAATVLGGTTATADPSAEGSFLEEISINNATLPGKKPDEMVAAGYATCDHLRGGTSVLDEIAAVETTYHFHQGALFVSAATTNLCPGFAG
ncbi:DUF732 domain-containing protein [Nocardia beijingensis]